MGYRIIIIVDYHNTYINSRISRGAEFIYTSNIYAIMHKCSRIRDHLYKFIYNIHAWDIAAL